MPPFPSQRRMSQGIRKAKIYRRGSQSCHLSGGVSGEQPREDSLAIKGSAAEEFACRDACPGGETQRLTRQKPRSHRCQPSRAKSSTQPQQKTRASRTAREARAASRPARQPQDTRTHLQQVSSGKRGKIRDPEAS